MPTPTIVLIVVAVAVVAAIAFFALRATRAAKVAVAVADAGADPAFSATGEAMIVGDVMPIDSNEPGMPPGTTEPPRATPGSARKAAQVYEAPRRAVVQAQPDATQRPSDVSRQERDPAQRQSDPSAGSGDWATQRAQIRWCKRFEPRDGALDDATRVSLLRDLGIVRAPWGVPLLTQAYEEELTVEARRAALRALAAYRHPDTQSTFESALRADDEESRAIAASALGALRIRAALPS